jgi:hypothetical protein
LLTVFFLLYTLALPPSNVSWQSLEETDIRVRESRFRGSRGCYLYVCTTTGHSGRVNLTSYFSFRVKPCHNHCNESHHPAVLYAPIQPNIRRSIDNIPEERTRTLRELFVYAYEQSTIRNDIVPCSSLGPRCSHSSHGYRNYGGVCRNVEAWKEQAGPRV